MGESSWLSLFILAVPENDPARATGTKRAGLPPGLSSMSFSISSICRVRSLRFTNWEETDLKRLDFLALPVAPSSLVEFFPSVKIG